MKTLAAISAEQFREIAQHLGPCELVRGEIVPMAPGGFDHTDATSNIVHILGAFVRARKLGRVLTNEAGFVVERHPDTVRGADVAFISYLRLPKNFRSAEFLEQPPELIVEVLGEKQSWADIEQKVREYHAFGVDLAWVADPKTLSVRIYPKKGEPSLLHENASISAPKILPGFKCRVGEFFGV